MSLAERLGDPAWRATALLLLGMILAMVALRVLEARRIRGKFPRQSVVRTGFGVTFYGLESEPTAPWRLMGAVVLHRDGLYFRARVTGRELRIPRSEILNIRVTDSHRGRNLRQLAIAIRFRTAAGAGDTAAFRFPRPARWVTPLQQTLTPGRG